MIRCGCGHDIPLDAEHYAHTQVFEGFSVLIAYDCSNCFSTRAITFYEAFLDTDSEEPIAAE